MQYKINKLIEEIRSKEVELTTKRYPEEMEFAVQNAVNFKRYGHYEEATDIYIELIYQYPSTAFIMFLYKVVAPAGYLKEAAELLNVSSNAYEQSPSILASQYSIQSNMDVHRDKLLKAIKYKDRLLSYLRSIAGNPNYYFVRDFEVMKRELVDYYNLSI